MQKMIMTVLLAVAVPVTLTQQALAAQTGDDGPASGSAVSGQHVELLAQAFDGVDTGTIESLEQPALEDTRGELWPFIIGVASLDLALSSYFWGVYVPAVGGGGSCVTCSYALTTAQH